MERTLDEEKTMLSKNSITACEARDAMTERIDPARSNVHAPERSA